MAITRDQQITLVAHAAGITAKQARAAIEAVESVVLLGLADEGRITLHGLGTFSTQRRSPRRVINPSTGELMDIPAKVAVKFKPAAHVRQRVEESHS